MTSVYCTSTSEINRPASRLRALILFIQTLALSKSFTYLLTYLLTYSTRLAGLEIKGHRAPRGTNVDLRNYAFDL